MSRIIRYISDFMGVHNYRPDDLKKGNIDLDELDEYLRFSCRHYKVTTFTDKPEGQEEEASTVESLQG